MIIRSLAQVTAQMNVLQKKQENSAANVANVNTPGYKFQVLLQETQKEYEVHNHTGGRDNNAYQALGSLSLGTQLGEAYTNFTPGTLTQTGLATDFAIQGKGFFPVALEDNTLGFTRSGSFRRDAEGYLVTPEGYRVLGVDPQGNWQSISTGGNPLVLTAEGQIQGTVLRLAAVDVADYTQLTLEGGSLFAGETAVIPGEGEILQGYLEGSNVNLLDEMVKMMEVSREFQANQRTLKVLNDTLSKTVNEIGRN